MKLYTRKNIKEIADKYGFRRSDRLGQNFLVDKNIIDKIVVATRLDDKTLAIEIGPGMGVLTRELAAEAGHVVAIELDTRLLPILEDTLAEFDNVDIINGDILNIDLKKIISKLNYEKIVIVGNLPYYITTPIILDILEKEVPMDRLVIMLQKEVAERINAEPGNKTYGALSVACQFYCDVSYVATVPRSVFSPPPKVDSSVLCLNRRRELPWAIEDRKHFFKIVRAGFNQRRKTLLNSVSALDDVDKKQLREVLKNIGIDEKRRAETLTIREFALLSNRLLEV